jgi:hypothetical protein
VSRFEFRFAPRKARHSSGLVSIRVQGRRSSPIADLVADSALFHRGCFCHAAKGLVAHASVPEEPCHKRYGSRSAPNRRADTAAPNFRNIRQSPVRFKDRFPTVQEPWDQGLKQSAIDPVRPLRIRCALRCCRRRRAPPTACAAKFFSGACTPRALSGLGRGCVFTIIARDKRSFDPTGVRPEHSRKQQATRPHENRGILKLQDFVGRSRRFSLKLL